MNEAARHQVIIIGSGFAGLCMGIRLRQAGIEDFVILEQADDIGGTWRDNTYPGAGCDVPSHLYSFSFAPNPDWSRMFASQPEIWAYMQQCADRFGLRPFIRLNQRVTRAEFDETEDQWRVQVNGEAWLQARFLVSGVGALSRPAQPDIPGLSSYTGKLFHSARWDHNYDLTAKKVGVIGTGASTIQLLPNIAPLAAYTTVFQRTPPWILPKPDRMISPMERSLYRRYPFLLWLSRQVIYWVLEWRVMGFVLHPGVMKLVEKKALAHLTRQTTDPALRAKLTPQYTLGCKRVLISNDYYQALGRKDVALETTPIDRVTPSGVRTRDGVDHEFDAIILATGFQAAEAVIPFDLIGLGGVSLNQAWEDGAEAMLGVTVSGFPNFFMVVGPNSGLGHSSMIFMIESQVNYILDAMNKARELGVRQIHLRSRAQRLFNESLQHRLQRSVWKSGCQSWYQTKSGKITTLWPGFTVEYRRRTRKVNEADYEWL
ncbi:predicted flavoprotein involved in K+ transport [Hahella chejuensis KCTC 2396]|uniref:Predicted flavoprotein involved in K+ transport n=1 Tax=Hahella chejuensis (strain KCTC 2396) TaxID=349521 RepID=Q2SE69_HAHCH|nr:NAD(P)/FAD-dependent oxidoreductase [Hahella chejuensis]ABC31055.1 predicted flavoprotein involved in K+ transport [Hahella chejuensis KCTC 2396]